MALGTGLGIGLGKGLALLLTLIEDCGDCNEIKDLREVSTGMFWVIVALLVVGLPDKSLVGSPWI
jgi:hypothetical protein